MKYLTFAQLRDKLGGRARSTIYLDVEAGRLPPPIKLGGRLYWCEERVDGHLLNIATEQPESSGEGDTDECSANSGFGPGERRNEAGGFRRPIRETVRYRVGSRRSTSADEVGGATPDRFSKDREARPTTGPAKPSRLASSRRVKKQEG